MTVMDNSIAGERVAAGLERPGASLPARLPGRLGGPALGLLLPVLAALGWELAVWAGWSTGRLVPPPSVIWDTFLHLAEGGELGRHAATTLTRVAIGFGAGVAAGTLVGAVTGYSRFAGRLLDPDRKSVV